MVINLRPHQELAVSKMSNGKVLIGGVGTGKTPTALAYYFTHVLGGVLNDLGSVQQPVDLYILTTAMKRDSLDWQKWASQIGISVDNREDSIFNIRFVIDSYNNIKKYKDVRKAFFIFDEQRLVGAGEWSKNFIKIAHNNQWIMLSATPGDTWMDYIPLFIANRYYKNRTEFKRRHCVFSYYGKYPKLERYLEEGRLLKLKRNILVDMPYERHTKRHISQVPVKYDVDLFRNTVKKRWNPYEEKPLKDASELFLVMRKIVNSDSSRIEALRFLIQKHPRLIVYYNFDYELHALRSLADSLVKEQKFKSKKEQVCQNQTTRISQTSFETISNSNSRPDNGILYEPISLAEACQLCQNDRSYGHHGNLMWVLDTLGDYDQESHISMRSRESSSTTTTLPISHSIHSSATSKDVSKTTSPEDSEGNTVKFCSAHQIAKKQCETTPVMENENQTRELCEKCQTSLVNPVVADIGATTKTFVSGEGESSSSRLSTQPSTSGWKSFAVAEWNGHKHQPIPETDSWLYFVQYASGAEGWNCTSTDAMVFFSLTYSYKYFAQAQGRIDRMNTLYTDLYYYILMSGSSIDLAVSKALKNKRNFNEKDFIDAD